MAETEIPEAALAAACNLVWPHTACGCGPAVHDEGDVRKVLQAAAPHIGAAYLEQARRSITGLLLEATVAACDAAWNPDLTEGERQHCYGRRGGLEAALEVLKELEADRG